MKTTKNAAKTGALGLAIILAILAIAIASSSYGWHRVVSAQSPGDSANPDNPQAVAHGKILFFRGFGASATMYMVNPAAPGSETAIGPAGQYPLWKPDGSAILFVDPTSHDGSNQNSGELKLMDPDGSNVRTLATRTYSASFIGPAAWSPDGTKIAFIRPCSSCGQFSTDIWMMNADGSGQTQLTNASHGDSSPSWQPGGNTIAFTRQFANGAQIFTVTTGKTENQLTNVVNANSRNARWSPDGSKLVFESDRDTGFGFRPEIYVMNAAGSNVQRITKNLTNPNGSNPPNFDDTYDDHNPTFSPDGTLIAWLSGSRPETSNNKVFVMNADGTNQHLITGGTDSDSSSPSWAALLPHIASFTKTGPTNGSITFNAVTDSGLAVRVQSTTTPTFEVTWTDLPDGNGAKMNEDTTGNYSLTTTAYPHTNGISFRAISSKTGFTDGKSDPVGPYDLAPTPTPTPTPTPAPGAPTIATDGTGLNPSSAIAGGGSFNLRVKGTGFVSGSVVRFNGTDHPGGFDSGNPSILTVQILAQEIQTAGIYSVTVVNPGAPPSNAVNFTVSFPATLTFDGRLRDRVSPTDTGTGADGNPDGTLTLTLPAAVANKFLSKIELSGPNGSGWDTVTNTVPVLGISSTLDAALINAGGSIPQNFPVGNNAVFKLFASETNPAVFVQGNVFNVTVTFSDNTTAVGSATVTQTPKVDFTINVTDSPRPATADAALTYKMQITNTGTMSAKNALANTAIDGDTFLVQAGPAGSGTSTGCASLKDAQGNNTRNIVCTLGNINPGDTIQKSIQVRPKGNQNQVVFTADVRNDFANTPSGSATVNTPVGSISHPANDNFLNATPLTGATSAANQLTGSNVGAREENPIYYTADHTIFRDKEAPHCCDGHIVYGGKSVWYSWTPPANSTGTMMIDTSGSKVDGSVNASPFDSILAVYAQANNTHTIAKIASSDDVSPTDPTSAVTFDYDSAHTYYIVVDGKQGATSSQFKLNWIAEPKGSASTTVTQNISVGFFPSDNCSSNSNAPSICQRQVDNVGRIVLDIRGQNFTPNSLVVVDGKSVLGWTGTDLQGNPITGQVTYLGPDHLQAAIPANPPLRHVGPLIVQVVTPIPTGPISQILALGGLQPNAACAIDTVFCTGLADGKYGVAFGSRVGNVFEAQQATINPGETKQVCGNFIVDATGTKAGMCITFTNNSTLTDTISPTFFSTWGSCFAVAKASADPDKFSQCAGPLRDLASTMGMRLGSPPDFGTSPQNVIKISQSLDLPAGSVSAVKLALAGGTVNPAGVVLTNGGALIGSDGAGLIGSDGAGLKGTSPVISNDGGSIISEHGVGLIGSDGAGLIGSDGAGLIGSDGAGVVISGGKIVSHDGGTIAQPGGESIFSKETNSASSAPPDGIRPYGPSTLSNGIGGMIISGGPQPTFTSTVDPVTGEVHGTVEYTIDNTTFPRITNLKGLAFTVLVNPAVIQVASSNITVDKSAGRATVTILRTGDTTRSASVDFATQNDTANARSDYSPVFGNVSFAPGETSKNITIPLINHGYGSTTFGASRKFELVIGNAVGGAIQVPNFATITITNNQATNSTTNPLDNSDARFYVRQQYLDFLSREPDQSGWDFWSNEITSCGTNQQCIDLKRVNVSAAYFLSIEFQQTGYLVERLYRTAYGNASGASTFGGAHQLAVPVVRFNEFLPDTQQIGRGVVVGQTGWEQVLENNKQAFAAEFVQRSRFTAAFPTSMTAAQFVDSLNANAGNPLSQTDRNQLVSDLSSGAKTRAQVLRAVAENQNLYNAEFNRAFVLMQFFGYLRRDPNSGQDTDYTGFDFWLTKLNAFNGNFQNAEMVKAFITSTEYRQRFGP